MIYIIDFRGADVGGPVVPGRVVRIGSLPVAQGTEDNLRLESTITFLLHGFNVNRQHGRESLVRLASYLPSVAGTAIAAILWPGDHWTGAISYPFEGTDADDSAAEVARFIDRVVRPGVELSFVSHSLGARVVMGAVARLVAGRYLIRQICLMAAAIDDFSLADPEEYREAVASAQRTAVLASRRDKVLRFAYPAGDLLQAFIFFGRDEVGLALGYHGPKPAAEHAIPDKVYHLQIPDGRNSDHDHYLPDNSPSLNQRSAAQFADEVLQGSITPRYP